MTRTITVLLFAVVCLAARSAGAGTIAVIISADVPPYWESLAGYKEIVDHTIVAEFDMKGDFDRGKGIVAEIESKVKPDLILAMGVWALQAVVRESPDRPVVFAMVLNPPTVLGGEVRNVTGASMNIPVDRPIDVLEQLGPDIRKIGVVFNPSKTGYMVEAAEAAARQRGLTLVARPISSPRDAIRAMDAWSIPQLIGVGGLVGAAGAGSLPLAIGAGIAAGLGFGIELLFQRKQVSVERRLSSDLLRPAAVGIEQLIA